MVTAEVRSERAVAAAARRGLALWPHRVLVAVMTAGAAGLYVFIGLGAYLNYTVGSYDLVIFDQAIRSYSNLGWPASIVKGVHNELGPDFHILGDHFSPILATLAPLYWIHDHPVMLIAAEAVLFAAAIPIVWVAARRVVGLRAAYAVAAVFALGWPLHVASVKGFHEVGFAVPLTVLALERLLAGRYRQAALVALALLLVKEDMGLLVAGIGLLIAWRGRRDVTVRRMGLGLSVAGIVAAVIVVNVLIPLTGGEAGYYWYYDQLGANPFEALRHVIFHPLDTLQIAVTPGRKAQTLLWLLAPLLLLPLASPVTLLAIPLVAERVFSSNPNHWSPDQHYDAFIWPILVMAAIDALHPDRVRRIAARFRTLRQMGPRWAVLALAASAVIVLLVPRFQLWDLPNGQTGPHGREGAAAAAARLIPDGATVEADNELGPHLTTRATVLLFDEKPRGAEWVIADTMQTSFPWREFEPQRQRIVELLSSDEYELVYAERGYLVLHRTDGLPQ